MLLYFMYSVCVWILYSYVVFVYPKENIKNWGGGGGNIIHFLNSYIIIIIMLKILPFIPNYI